MDAELIFRNFAERMQTKYGTYEEQLAALKLAEEAQKLEIKPCTFQLGRLDSSQSVTCQGAPNEATHVRPKHRLLFTSHRITEPAPLPKARFQLVPIRLLPKSTKQTQNLLNSHPPIFTNIRRWSARPRKERSDRQPRGPLPRKRHRESAIQRRPRRSTKRTQLNRTGGSVQDLRRLRQSASPRSGSPPVLATLRSGRSPCNSYWRTFGQRNETKPR